MQNLQFQKTGIALSQAEGAVLKERELMRVTQFIGNEVGIQLPASKHKLVESRLRRRLRALNFDDFKSYLDHTLDSGDGENERLQLIDVITTKKTNFYHEPEHFDYLVQTAIPELKIIKSNEGKRELKLWSAGCSTGEEPYTLSLLLNEVASIQRDFLFNILATDISYNCLSTASQGVYKESHVEVIPLELRKKYILHNQNTGKGLVQMGAQLRRYIQFKCFNLMDKKFMLPEKMDIIFCRNVMIYFNNVLREELVAKFESQLVNGGYLFVGHSESLSGIKTNLIQVAPMVYQKTHK